MKTAIAKHTHTTEIDGGRRRSRDDFQADGTPHFFINGRRLVGAQPQGEVRGDHRRGDREGAGARSRTGPSPTDALRALTKDGQGPPRAGDARPSRALAGARPAARQPEREGGRARVGRLPVPVLRARRAHAAAAREGLRRRGSASCGTTCRCPCTRTRAARGAGRARGAPAEGATGLLEDARHAVRGPDRSSSAPTSTATRRALGLDMTKWAAALDGDGHEAEVDADAEAAADAGHQRHAVVRHRRRGREDRILCRGGAGLAHLPRLIDRAQSEMRR